MVEVIVVATPSRVMRRVAPKVRFDPVLMVMNAVTGARSWWSRWLRGHAQPRHASGGAELRAMGELIAAWWGAWHAIDPARRARAGWSHRRELEEQ